MITAHELETLLRAYGGPLEGCRVEQHILAPYIYKFVGRCMLKGKPHDYEAEFDARGLAGVADVHTLVEQLLDNLRHAEAQA
jgi:hypothetical protein